jgi:superfamily II DNA or RNA helicase
VVPESDLVVFDEAHRLGARTFRTAANALLETREAPPALLGLSATPGRVDPEETEDLVSLFGGSLLKSDRLSPNPVRVLQKRGVLSKLSFKPLGKRPPPPEAEGKRIVVATRACRALEARGRKILVFAASVPGALVLAEALQSVGVSAAAVHSELTSTERKRAISNFAADKVRVLVNHRLLATGYDCPAVSDVVITSRISSPILFEQIVGRAARGPRTGGSPIGTIWEFDDNLGVHGLPQSYYRFRDFDWS